MQYGNMYVDEKYSAILEPNLYADSILEPNKTYNPEHQGDAKSGLVKIYKSTRDSAGDPSATAGDFTHENTENTLIDLRLNNAFRKSKKIYKVTADSVAYSVADEVLSTAINDNKEDMQRSAIGCLVKEGSAAADTAAIAADNIKSKIIALRKAARKDHAKPDTVIASVDVYSIMLEVAGKDYTPSTNENTLTTGRVGTWLGMTWYEGDIIGGTAKYYDHAGTLQTVTLDDVELIMYDHKAFHCVNNLEVMRIVDALDFVGSYAQNEINVGFRVSNDKKVIVKKKA